MSRSPLNYSDVGYDPVGPAVHADGEIWSATNLRVRAALVKRYGPGTPARQLACARGPGRRRPVPGQPALGAAGLRLVPAPGLQPVQHARHAGQHARRRPGPLRRRQPGPDLERVRRVRAWAGTPTSGAGRHRPDAELRLAARATTPRVTAAAAGRRRRTRPIRLYVGDYEARAMPVADTDPATPLPDTVPDRARHVRSSFVAVGAGLRAPASSRAVPGRPGRGRCDAEPAAATSPRPPSGARRHRRRGQPRPDRRRHRGDELGVPGRRGRQAGHRRPGRGPAAAGPAGQRQRACCARRSPATPTPARRTRSARCGRSQILACNATDGRLHAGRRATSAVFTSAAGRVPRRARSGRSARELNLRTFAVPPTVATHLRIRVLASQCTGGPLYAGEQDDDPARGDRLRDRQPGRGTGPDRGVPGLQALT